MGAIRRNTELGLILLVVLITCGIYTLASLAQTASIPANIGPFLGLVLVLLVVGHVAVRRLAPNADGLLLPLAGLLNGIGYVFIARLNTGLADNQSTWTIIGIGAFIGTLVLIRETRMLQRYRYTLALVGVGLVLLPLVPGIGREINGARIWARVGPINMQPGEFAKIVLAVFAAAYLVEKRELLRLTTLRVGPLLLPDARHFGPVLVAWIVSLVVMVWERDLGSSLLFFTMFVVMLWLATERAAYLAISAVLFIIGSVAAWSRFTHVQTRVDIWLDPWEDPLGRGFQVLEGSFAMASGGIAGTGPGLGKSGRLPAKETDFIFAIIGEELGLLGSTAIILAFVMMIGAGLRIALRAEPPFDKLLAAGLTTLLGFQAFIIIAGVVRLLPLTGVTLPFVSYGGSSLVSNYILLALLLRISDETSGRLQRRAEQPDPEAEAPPVAVGV